MTAPGDLPDCIAEVFAHIVEPRQAAEDVELDLPYSIREAQRWLADQPVAIDGIASDLFFRQAARLKDMAISVEKATELLHERNPSYDEDDIRQRVENAHKHGQNETGSDRPRSDDEVFDGVTLPEPPAPLTDHGFRGIAWLREQEFPKTRWQWDNLIPSFRPIVITGPAKTGKTTFLLNLAVHMAAGVDFLGAAVRPSDVAMMLAEDEYGQVRDNVEAIRFALGCDPAVLERLHFRSVLSEPVPGGHCLCRIDDQGNATGSQFMREIVLPFLQRLNEPVWMVDPLVEFVALNRYSEQGPRGLVHWLSEVAKVGNGVTPLITDHPTIASVEQGRDIGGSVQMESSFPTVGALKAGKWKDAVIPRRPMSFETKYARYAREQQINFFRLAKTPAFSLNGGPGSTAGDRRESVFNFVVDKLEENPPHLIGKDNHGSEYRWGGPREIASELDLSEPEVKEALADLCKLGWLEYELRGNIGKGHTTPHYDKGAEFGSPDAKKARRPVTISEPFVEPTTW